MRESAEPKVAVVGCGVWGRNHVRTHASIGSLAAVCDHHPERAAALAEAHGVPARTLDAVLADPAIEALVLALPPSQNLPVGLAGLAAGKHLLVEKPMALSSPDALRLCRAAAEAGRRLMVGHILRYHPAFLRLRESVAGGALGRLLRIVSTRFDFGRIRREEDALWALAPHDVSMILALAGREPDGVAARGARHTHPSIADAASVELGFPDGLQAEIRVSWLHPTKEQRLCVVGEAGMMVFDDREAWDRKLVHYPHRIVERDGRPWAEKAEGAPVPLEPAEPLEQEALHFLRSIRTGEVPWTDGREGMRVLAVLERASAAMAAGREVSTTPGGHGPICA